MVRPAGVIEDVAGTEAVGTVNGFGWALPLLVRGGRRVAVAARQTLIDIERLDVATLPAHDR